MFLWLAAAPTKLCSAAEPRGAGSVDVLLTKEAETGLGGGKLGQRGA